MNLWAIFGTALSALLLGVVEWMKLGQAKRDGAALEAGTTASVTAKAEARMVEAATQAPSTVAGTIDALKRGEF